MVFLRAGQFGVQDFYAQQLYGDSFLTEFVGAAPGNLFSTTFMSFDPGSTSGAEIRVVPTQHFYWKSTIAAGNRNPFGTIPQAFTFGSGIQAWVHSKSGFLRRILGAAPKDGEWAGRGKHIPGSTESAGAITRGDSRTRLQARGPAATI
jgi:hypothetical protein